MGKKRLAIAAVVVLLAAGTTVLLWPHHDPGETPRSRVTSRRAARASLDREIEPVFCDVVRPRWAEFVEGYGGRLGVCSGPGI